jgi:hypothetical protein
VSQNTNETTYKEKLSDKLVESDDLKVL